MEVVEAQGGCRMTSLASMAETVAGLLKQRSETVAIAESSTGGLISAALLAVPGASAYFSGGGVIYTQAARKALLGIDLDAYPGMRPSTEPYALLLADTVRDRLGATWGVGETGASGPSGNRYGDQPGHSCMAVCGPERRALTLETERSGREDNMQRFAIEALCLFEDVLRDA
jgi:PncC family amidohydrolase